MKLVKILNIKGALLDKYQLENYLEKMASDHVLQDKSQKDTYPIPRMQDNFKFITATYEILNRDIKMGINIHPAGEWLLDNYYIIEETVKTIQKEMSLKKYTNFVGLSNGAYAGFARIYVLATEIVAYTDANINTHNLEELLNAYQNKKTLNMEEIWNIGIFLQIAIIENIRNICEKIYSSQLQKYKVESILERLVEYKSKDEQKYRQNMNYKNKIAEVGQIKYPFIEYMSYRLKKYGRKAYSYLNVLEEQVMKMGTNVSDVIRKEHFDIAVKKLAIGNCIKSIKEIQRINFLEIFENINGVEEILKKDPSCVYEKMDYKTKAYYREKIKEISKKTKISELYIASKALELARNEENKKEKEERKAHIGYYLISDGIQDLYSVLQTNKKPYMKNEAKQKAYIVAIVLISAIISLFFCISIYNKTNIYFAVLIFVLTYIPITQITTEIIQFLLGKIVKPKLIPKMDFENGIPNDSTTMVIIPTIVKNPKKVKDLISKLEVFYIANKSDNLYFTLLADASASTKANEDYDIDIVNVGIQEINRLNKKYSKDGMGIFQFIYRKRTWCESEKCYLGWERKRGLINQFNEYLLGNIKNPFKANTIEEYRKIDKLPEIKYIITLDSDTNLVLNSGLELIGTAAHILNKPILNKNQDLVINGHALIQPRVGIDLVSCSKSIFTKIFAGAGGIDSYTNAISDVYQDNFEQGIFTGKGIYDLKVFSKVLKNEIPPNTVLSHDLLEGNYLRCALASDILLLDGYPYKYNSFITRQARWIRGDWQIIRWIKKNIKDSAGKIKKNPLNTLSKYKILDNLRRSLVEICILINILVLSTLKMFFGITIWQIVSIMLITILTPMILEILTYVTSKQSDAINHKYFVKTITGLKATMLRGIIILANLPHKAYISFNSIVKTIYRMKISKHNLLEWTTAEEAEEAGKTDLLSYYKLMMVNVISGIVGILILFTYPQYFINIIMYAICILWIIAPLITWYIRKEEIQKADVRKLNKDDINYVLEIGKKTWEYFETYINEKNNFLPPDNYQENRHPLTVDRTSSTNIGLGLMSIISAYDLGYIDLDYSIDLMKNMLNTIMNLSKWNGHLYNWYNTKTLQPLIPKYISTVDSGNFVGYLYVVKEFLKNIVNNNLKKQKYENTDLINNMISNIEDLIQKTDFSVLYDYEKRLFSIGFNVEENKLTDSYYDLLASEARQASIVAIAKKDVSSKHWQNLSRTLTVMNKYKGLVSWSGTAFEYLMPNVNIKRYPRKPT